MTSESGYRVVSISLYDDDIAQIDAKVADLRARGYRRASRSVLIRIAIALLDTRNVEPPGQIPTAITSRPASVNDLLVTDGVGR